MKEVEDKDIVKFTAYKVFNSDWTCRGYDFKKNNGSAIGSIYEIKNCKLELCNSGFHFCRKPNMCFNYYNFDNKNKVAEIEILGDFMGDPEDKECSNKIKIVRELSWEEVLRVVNTGKANSGHSNSGHSNSGHRNSGDWNSGDSNSGHSNSGHRNSGDWNSGDWNSGDSNSGRRNSGDSNSGHRNSGDWNSGDWNSGHSNSGHSNSGDRNSGHSNSGHRNSGDWNSGDRNSGDWNSCNYETGFFNSTQSSVVRVFNKDCDRKLWENSNKPDFIYFNLTEWISFNDMTDEEKAEYPKAYVCGGYLKTYSYKEAWQNAYNNAPKEDIELLKALPNFDAKVFYEISGINIE